MMDTDKDFPDLKGSLTPPPSPLGREFARVTAAAVLRRATQQGPDREPPDGGGGTQAAKWKLESSPLYPMVRRWSDASALKPLQSLLLMALYALPCLWVFWQGTTQNSRLFQGFYFGAVFLGACVALPGVLLSRTYDFYQRLVRGRGVEEMVQAGLAGTSLVDGFVRLNLAACTPILLLSLASLIPAALLHTDLMTFEDPLLPQFLSHRPGIGLLAWPLVAVAVFVSGCYTLQSHAFGAAKKAWIWAGLNLMGCLILWGGALQQLPAQGVVGFFVCLIAGIGARSSTLHCFELMSQGRSPVRVASRKAGGLKVGLLEQWLRQQLSAFPLTYMEIGRNRLLNWKIVVITALVARTSNLTEPALYLAWAAALGCYLACSFLQRERSSGTLETLTQAGFNRESVTSNLWLGAILRSVAPSLVIATYSYWSCANPPSLVLIPALCLGVVASLGAGTWLGVQVSWDAQGYRKILPTLLTAMLILAYIVGAMSVTNDVLVVRVYRALDFSISDSNPSWIWQFFELWRIGAGAISLLAGLAFVNRALKRGTWPAFWALAILPVLALPHPGLAGLETQSFFDFLAVGVWLWWTGGQSRRIGNFRTLASWAKYLGFAALFVGFSVFLENLMQVFTLFLSPQYSSATQVNGPWLATFLGYGVGWVIAVGLVSAWWNLPAQDGMQEPLPAFRTRTSLLVATLVGMLWFVNAQVSKWSHWVATKPFNSDLRFDSEGESYLLRWNPKKFQPRTAATSAELRAMHSQMPLPKITELDFPQAVAITARYDVRLFGDWIYSSWGSLLDKSTNMEWLEHLPLLQRVSVVAPLHTNGQPIALEVLTRLTRQMRIQQLNQKQVGAVEHFVDSLPSDEQYVWKMLVAAGIRMWPQQATPDSGFYEFYNAGLQQQRFAMLEEQKDSRLLHNRLLWQLEFAKDAARIEIQLQKMRLAGQEVPDRMVLEKGLKRRYLYRRSPAGTLMAPVNQASDFEMSW